MEHLLPQDASDAVRLDSRLRRAKVPEFIGVDRFPWPAWTLWPTSTHACPFADDSVDLVYASHSLEHVRDLSSVVREISHLQAWRLCIVALPYHTQD